MSNDRSLRNAEIVFTKGQFFSSPTQDGMVYAASLPIDGEDMKELTAEFDSRSLCLKALGGYMQDGDLKIPFENLHELGEFLDYVDRRMDDEDEPLNISKVRAALEFEGCSSIDEAQFVVEHIEDFNYIEGAKSFKELGEYVLHKLVSDPVYNEIEHAMNIDVFGENYYRSGDFPCGFTSTGFIEETESYYVRKVEKNPSLLVQEKMTAAREKTWEFIGIIKKTYAAGTRIRLGIMAGEPQMLSGLEGTVFAVDDDGQIHVKWDNGSTLALNAKQDSFEIIPDNAPAMEPTM